MKTVLILALSALAIPASCLADDEPVKAILEQTKSLSAYDTPGRINALDQAEEAATTPEARATVDLARAKAVEADGQHAAAAVLYARAAAALPQDDALRANAIWHMVRGALKRGDLAKATQVAQQETTDWPENPDGYTSWAAVMAATAATPADWMAVAAMHETARQKNVVTKGRSQWWELRDRAAALAKAGWTPAEVNAVIAPILTGAAVTHPKAFQACLEQAVDQTVMSPTAQQEFAAAVLAVVPASQETAALRATLVPDEKHPEKTQALTALNAAGKLSPDTTLGAQQVALKARLEKEGPTKEVLAQVARLKQDAASANAVAADAAKESAK